MKRAFLFLLAGIAMDICLNSLDMLPRWITAPPPAEAASPLLDRFEIEMGKIKEDLDALDVLDKGWAAYRRGDYSTAYRVWLPLAKRGDAFAQLLIGAMYNEGIGVTKDLTETLKWWRIAAIQGNADAQFNLGLKYEKGEGIRQDSAEALKWFRLAASNGIVRAQLKVAVIFLLGKIVPQDFSEALKWYRLASEQGNAVAQFSIGAMYARGDGVPKDDAEPSDGTALPLTRVWPRLSTIWALSTWRARALHKTMFWHICG